MAHTIQSVSPMVIHKKKAASLSCVEALNQAKNDTRENINLIISVNNSLNYLSSLLLRLNDAMEKSIEFDIIQTEMGKASPHSGDA